MRYLTGALLLAALFAGPATAGAASRYGGNVWSASTTEGTGDVDPAEIRGWHRGSPFQAAIDALGTTAEQNLPIPVLFGVAVSDLTKNFGDPRSGGRTHEGLDILAPRATPVASPAASVVLRVGVGANSGNYVYAAAPGGETFVYMHLNQPSALHAGDVLKRGDLIGYVGDTGNALGGPTHLHFEIRKDGTATDPYPRLTAVFSPEEVAAKVGALGTMPQRDLKLGMRGSEVIWLQNFLIQKRTGTAAAALEAAGATGYFGALTRAALAEYQAKSGISPAAGYFGPITRAAILAS